MTKEKHENFMIVEDWVLDTVGLYSANVYGVVLRHEEMRQGKCFASIDTMRMKVKMGRTTFCRHLSKLKQEGFIKDLTPDRVKAPHEYVTVKEGMWKRKQNGVKVRESGNLVPERTLSSTVEDLDYTRRGPRLVPEGTARILIGDNEETNEDTNTSHHKKNCDVTVVLRTNSTAESVNSSKEDNVRNYVPGPANYTNGDPVKAYRNMARLRISAESEALIAESVTDVPAWESVLRKAKLDKLDLANVPVLLTEYASCR